MDGFDDLTSEYWGEKTVKAITYLQFELGRIEDSVLPENIIKKERLSHAMACLLPHYRCRMGRAPGISLKNTASNEEYYRLINLEHKANTSKDVQTEAEEEKECIYATIFKATMFCVILFHAFLKGTRTEVSLEQQRRRST